MNFTLQIQNQQSLVLNCCHLWREEDFVPSNTYAKWNQILCNASFAQDVQHKEYPSPTRCCQKYLPRCCLHPTLVACNYFDHLTYLQPACYNEKAITHWFLFSIFQNCWKMNVACPLVFLFPCQSCLQSTNLK